MRKHGDRKKTPRSLIVSIKSNIASSSFSDLEKVFAELSRLRQETLSHLFEIEETKQKILEAQALAQIEAKVYAGIKKHFKLVSHD